VLKENKKNLRNRKKKYEKQEQEKKNTKNRNRKIDFTFFQKIVRSPYRKIRLPFAAVNPMVVCHPDSGVK
jgi:hypothetical protein